MGKFIKFFKKSSGFTLIEAIISIAIVGIIVAPISMVFSKSLSHSLEAKHQLKATQIAQLFVENIKSKPESEFMNFFDAIPATQTKTINSLTASAYGFPTIPQGYTVTIQYEKDAAPFNGSNYGIPVLTPAVGFDFSLAFNSASSYSFSVNDLNVIPTIDYPQSCQFPPERVVHIYYNANHNNIYIKDGSGPTLTTYTFSVSGLSNVYNAFRIDCTGNESTNIIPTKIYIHNEQSSTTPPVKVYIYKDATSTVDLIINDNPLLCEGSIITKYNMKDAAISNATRKIYSFTVSVVSDSGITSEVIATKVDE